MQSEGKDHGDQKNDCKTVGDLSQEYLENGNPFSILELVEAILREAICRFVFAEAMASKKLVLTTVMVLVAARA